jgi:hypothetical protein
MANWAFEIDITDAYIVGLTETLTDKGFRIWCAHNDGQPVYLFSSAYLSAIPDDEVYMQARHLVRYIDGISYLLFENKSQVNKIALTTVMDVDTFTVMNVQRDGSPASVNFAAYKPRIIEDEHPIAHLLKMVSADAFIRNLLLVLSQGMDAKHLRQTHDYISSFLAAKGEGISAVKEMPLSDAQQFLTERVFAVLEKYYSISLKPYVIKDKAAEWDDFYDTLYD